MTKKQQSELEAIELLRETLKPGSTVFTVLRAVSRSGMSRNIDCYVIQDNKPRWISGLVARATGFTLDKKRDSLKVSGCGMDMGFHIVSTLSRVMYRDGFDCLGEKCPSNDHSNSWYAVRDGNCPCCERSGLSKAEHNQANKTDFAKNKAGYTVCCRCAEHDTTWHHKSGDYALRHEWM